MVLMVDSITRGEYSTLVMWKHHGQHRTSQVLQQCTGSIPGPLLLVSTQVTVRTLTESPLTVGATIMLRTVPVGDLIRSFLKETVSLCGGY